jgi:hypothetical protein
MKAEVSAVLARAGPGFATVMAASLDAQIAKLPKSPKAFPGARAYGSSGPRFKRKGWGGTW